VEALRETFVIAGQDLKGALRSVKGIVLLALYALASLASGAVIVHLQAKALSALEAQLKQMGHQVTAAQMEAARHAASLKVYGLFIHDKSQVLYLASIPVFLVFVFAFSRVFLPPLIALMSYDQIDGEIRSRGLRFVLLRSRRGSVIAGKLVSNTALFLGITLITNAVLLAFAALRIPDFSVAAALPTLLRFWLLTLPLGLCFVTMMSWFSSMFRSPYLALIIGLLTMLGALLLSWLAGLIDAIHWVKWVIPYTYNDYLTNHLASHQLIGAGAYLGFAALFTLLSYVTLRRKDL